MKQSCQGKDGDKRVEKIKERWFQIWEGFEQRNPKLAKWIYQIFYFFVFSMGVTVFQYLVFTFMPGLLGYNVLRDATGAVLIGGGLGYFISYETGAFLAQCINFPLQRNITFKSHGNFLLCI